MDAFFERYNTIVMTICIAILIAFAWEVWSTPPPVVASPSPKSESCAKWMQMVHVARREWGLELRRAKWAEKKLEEAKRKLAELERQLSVIRGRSL